MSTPLLPAVVHEIDANPMSFTGKERVGASVMVWVPKVKGFQRQGGFALIPWTGALPLDLTALPPDPL